jgi:hypothetical protein
VSHLILKRLDQLNRPAGRIPAYRGAYRIMTARFKKLLVLIRIGGVVYATQKLPLNLVTHDRPVPFYEPVVKQLHDTAVRKRNFRRRRIFRILPDVAETL